MEVSANDVYRAVRVRYREASDDDVAEGVELAHVAIWEAKQRGTQIIDLRAFAICVAKRHVNTVQKWKSRHVYPDHDLGRTWRSLEMNHECLSVPASNQTTADTETVLRESPAHYAEVLRKHYLDGETFESIARETGATAACIRKRHERALKWAREHFKTEP